MSGLIAEFAGVMLAGTLFIYTLGVWRANRYEGFGSLAMQAASATFSSWVIISAIYAWGLWPARYEAVFAPVKLLPPAMLAYAFLLHRLRRLAAQENVAEVFED